MELKARTAKMQVFAMVTVISFGFLVSLPAQAQDAPETLYKSKCAMCHRAYGTGSATGKKMGAHDFTTAEVHGMTDAELSTIITNGKNRMPRVRTVFESG